MATPACCFAARDRESPRIVLMRIVRFLAAVRSDRPACDGSRLRVPQAPRHKRRTAHALMRSSFPVHIAVTQSLSVEGSFPDAASSGHGEGPGGFAPHRLLLPFSSSIASSRVIIIVCQHYGAPSNEEDFKLSARRRRGGINCIGRVRQGRSVPNGMPHLDHVFVIMMENHGYGQIVSNPNAPFTNSWQAAGTLRPTTSRSRIPA